MARHWRTIVVPLEEAEKSTGTWEPMQVVEDEDGTKLVICKGLFDTVDEGDKASEVSGSLGDSW
jgi:hypothetical protein